MTSRETFSLVAREQKFGELLAFVVITGIGGILVATASGYTILEEDGAVGGGFLPLLAGIVLTALGAVQLVAAALRVRAIAQDPDGMVCRARERSAADSLPDVFGRTARERLHQLALVVATVVAAVALAPVVGLLAALGALSVFISAVVERRSWYASVSISIASVGLVYVVFVLLLGIPLPGGLLFDQRW